MPRRICKCHNFAVRRKRNFLIFISGLALVILALQSELGVFQAPEGKVLLPASSRDTKNLQMISSTVGRLRFSLSPKGNHEKTSSVAVARKQEASDRQLRPSSCVRPQETSRFRELSNGVLVFSAWSDNRTTQHVIRILLLMYRNSPPPSLICSFQIASKQTIFTSEVVFYEHNENHHKQYGGFIASCIVPSELERMPCSINVSIKSTTKAQIVRNEALTLPVGSTDRLENTVGGKYGICVPPLHGDISVDRIVEFIELTRILGASHFTFYDLSINEEIRKALTQYETKGLVSVLEWNLPEYTSSELHYFGQVVSIMDCLYRSMRDKSFVAFHDLDEFIVPLQHDNINSLLKDIHKEHHCGYCFQSVVFDPSKDFESTNASSRDRLMTQRIFYRTSQVTPYWTKCIVDPRKIFEQGIHHISKPLEEFYQAEKVDWNIARVFHYRKCEDSRALMPLRCSGKFEVDKTMQKFQDQLVRNLEFVTNA